MRLLLKFMKNDSEAEAKNISGFVIAIAIFICVNGYIVAARLF